MANRTVKLVAEILSNLAEFEYNEEELRRFAEALRNRFIETRVPKMRIVHPQSMNFTAHDRFRNSEGGAA